MRALSVLGATVLQSLWRQAVAHPLCYYEDRPTDPTQVMVFCPEQEEGACCTDLEEMAAINVYKVPFPEGTVPTDECAEYYRQVTFSLITGHVQTNTDGSAVSSNAESRDTVFRRGLNIWCVEKRGNHLSLLDGCKHETIIFNDNTTPQASSC